MAFDLNGKSHDQIIDAAKNASKLADLISRRERQEQEMKETAAAMKEGLKSLDREIADLVAIIRDGETLPLFPESTDAYGEKAPS